MSVLFNHAIRHEWLGQGRNPILLVRQSSKRQRIPEWLEPEELTALLSQLDPCFRLMVFLDAVTGLRRSGLLALKWGDIEFEKLQITVQRSIYRNVVGNCKTESSRKPVPMDPILAAELWAWKQAQLLQSIPRLGVREPSYQGQEPLLARHPSFSCRPACRNASWNSKACWLAHVPAQLFHDIDRKRRKREGGARTYAALELPVHTGNIFSGRIQAKRDAQHRVIQMIVPWKGATDVQEPMILSKDTATEPNR